MPNVILFVDLLGVRSRWLRGGRPEAEAAFQDFRNLIAHGLRGCPANELIEGTIETDAAALTFSDVHPALRVAKRLFLAAFNQTARRESRRPWLRGCIVPRDGESELRTGSAFSGPLAQVKLMLYKPALLDAIAVEKSGYRGMRLLVSRDLVNSALNAATKLSIDGFSFIPLKKVRSSYYPKRVEETYVDYFWMATDDPAELTSLERVMALRLRASALDPEEFAQAAATQVLFHECSAIIGSLRTRKEFQDRKTARRVSRPTSVASE
jgi:hypothetical protein